MERNPQLKSPSISHSRVPLTKSGPSSGSPVLSMYYIVVLQLPDFFCPPLDVTQNSSEYTTVSTAKNIAKSYLIKRREIKHFSDSYIM